jgi:F-box protein 9
MAAPSNDPPDPAAHAKPAEAASTAPPAPQEVVALVNAVLKPDHLMHVASFLDGFTLGRVLCVCKAWRELFSDDAVWREACAQLWDDVWGERLQNRVARYGGSWKRTFVEYPHVRFDGLYCLEHSYFRSSDDRRTMIKVSYFRFLRFFPNGKVLYALLPTEDRVEEHFGPRSRCADVRKGMYKLYSGGMHFLVDMGYVSLYMKLAFANSIRGPHYRLDVEEFTGVYPRTRETVKYRIPDAPFYFFAVAPY